jgi:predicted nuclease with TOPRIM domain
VDRLARAVEEAIQEIEDLRIRLTQAEARVGESDELLREFVGGKQDPAGLARRLTLLEAENEALRARIEEGKAGVERVLAKIQFMEDR